MLSRHIFSIFHALFIGHVSKETIWLRLSHSLIGSRGVRTHDLTIVRLPLCHLSYRDLLRDAKGWKWLQCTEIPARSYNIPKPPSYFLIISRNVIKMMQLVYCSPASEASREVEMFNYTFLAHFCFKNSNFRLKKPHYVLELSINFGV